MADYQTEIKQIYIAESGVIGPENTPTGIFKKPVNSELKLTKLGLEGDLQVDKRVHGGPEKAIYHFPEENYALLSEALPHLAEAFIPGSIGENFSSTGVDDKQVHIGDTVRIGEVVLQVSQPRRPCWKVNHKFGNGHIAALLMSQGISGWYYRVLQEGVVQPGDKLKFESRLENSVAVDDIWQMFLEKLKKRLPPEAVRQDIPGLSEQWQFQ